MYFITGISENEDARYMYLKADEIIVYGIDYKHSYEMCPDNLVFSIYDTETKQVSNYDYIRYAIFSITHKIVIDSESYIPVIPVTLFNVLDKHLKLDDENINLIIDGIYFGGLTWRVVDSEVIFDFEDEKCLCELKCLTGFESDMFKLRMVYERGVTI